MTRTDLPTAAALTVRPGDTLILGYRHQLDLADSDEILGRLRAALPGVRAVILDGISHLAAAAPGLPADRRWVLVKGYHDSGAIDGVYGPFTKAHAEWLRDGPMQYAGAWTLAELQDITREPEAPDDPH
jgi:hypothetical protein